MILESVHQKPRTPPRDVAELNRACTERIASAMLWSMGIWIQTLAWFTRKVGAFAGIGPGQDWECLGVLPGQLFKCISCMQLTGIKKLLESNFMFRYPPSFLRSEISITNALVCALAATSYCATGKIHLDLKLQGRKSLGAGADGSVFTFEGFKFLS